jgi:Cd2+/Zn2+-exporting ATPase
MRRFIHKTRNVMTIIAGLLLFTGMIFGLTGHSSIRITMFILSTITAGVPIFVKAFYAIRMRSFSIELLVSIAVTGALVIHEFTESAVVTFLFLLGEFLEAITLEKTRSSLKELVDLSPKEAIVLREGKKVSIMSEEIINGDIIVIRSGEKISIDGTIIAGSAFVNEAALTGEAIPAGKKPFDPVYSGTIVDQGYIEVKAERVGDETTLAKMIELMEEAQEAKTRTEKFLDKFSGYYTFTAVFLTIFVFLLTRDIYFAITFLVIACPGALVIGAPVSNIAGVGNGAKNGILVKGGEVMERFSKVDILVFDKTGTLTKGKPDLTDIKVLADISENDLLRLAALAETLSEHHLGHTIVHEAKARSLNLSKSPKDGEIIKGLGIRAKVDAYEVLAGNQRLMNKEKILIPYSTEEYALQQEVLGNTVVYVALDGVLAGILSVSDQIREDAYRALGDLKKSGIKKLVMLTGDNRYTAKLAADKLGIHEHAAELLPEQKVNYLKKLQKNGQVVAMVGDGINDAPAIATADVGIAMGKAGADISKETADIVLMRDQLKQLAHAYSLSKAVNRNMKQNIYFAVSTVVLLLLGTLFGAVHLASGMFIHEASVLMVILNAMRLLKYSQKKRSWRLIDTQICYDEGFS